MLGDYGALDDVQLRLTNSSDIWHQVIRIRSSLHRHLMVLRQSGNLGLQLMN